MVPVMFEIRNGPDRCLIFGLFDFRSVNGASMELDSPFWIISITALIGILPALSYRDVLDNFGHNFKAIFGFYHFISML